MDYARAFAKSDYLTVGTARTIEIAAQALADDPPRRLADLAGGKGVAACDLAVALHCEAIVVDRYPPFLVDARMRIRRAGLDPRVFVIRADGKRLPFADRAVDAATCIGAAAIIGIPRVFDELVRITRPGGIVVVSDVVWRTKPDEPLGPEWGPPHDEIQHTLPEYIEVMEGAGLQHTATHPHPLSDWHDYIAPMKRVAQEARVAGDDAFAKELEDGFEVELRWAESYWDYVTIVARAQTGADTP